MVCQRAKPSSGDEARTDIDFPFARGLQQVRQARGDVLEWHVGLGLGLQVGGEQPTGTPQKPPDVKEPEWTAILKLAGYPVAGDALTTEDQVGKAGTFASTFCTKRRGRDSFETIFHSLGISTIPDAMSMPVNDL
jgi:hypothetical protein